MILITTAGKVGAEAARLLAAQGEPVRVLVRNPGKVAALSQAGVEVVEGDLEAPASIDAAIRDASSVILVSLAIPNQELNVVDSAVRADVDHVVKITSNASTDSPIARRRGQTAIEDGLIASGLRYTLLRNNVYMQNFLMLAPAIVKNSSFGANTGNGRAGLIDSRDVAAVAAQIATNPAPTRTRPTGPPVPSRSPTPTQQRSCHRCSAVQSAFTRSATRSRSRRWSASAFQSTSRR